jgi:hypothetical protein
MELLSSGVTRNFFRGVRPGIFFFLGGGFSTNSVEDRRQRERGSGGGNPPVRGPTQFANEWNPNSDWENEDLEAVAHQSGVPLNLQMSETRILVRLLWINFPRNWEFSSALSNFRNFGGGGFESPKHPSVRHCYWAIWNGVGLTCNNRISVGTVCNN